MALYYKSSKYFAHITFIFLKTHFCFTFKEWLNTDVGGFKAEMNNDSNKIFMYYFSSSHLGDEGLLLWKHRYFLKKKLKLLLHIRGGAHYVCSLCESRLWIIVFAKAIWLTPTDPPGLFIQSSRREQKTQNVVFFIYRNTSMNSFQLNCCSMFIKKIKEI